MLVVAWCIIAFSLPTDPQAHHASRKRPARGFRMQVRSALALRAACASPACGGGGLRGLAPPRAADRNATKRSDDKNEAQ